jgi:hypothetical protein
MDNRELDALIHEKLFGKCPHEWKQKHPGVYHGNNKMVCQKCGDETIRTMANACPQYSTSPGACSLVLDEIERRGWTLQILLLPDTIDVSLYTDYWKQRDEDCILAQNSLIGNKRIWRAVCEATLQAAEVSDANQD